MVLSNKKLKQKLRAEIAESLTSSAARPDANESPNPDPNAQTRSLKHLLDSVSQKPKLSKREKKRRRGHDSETLNSNKGGGDVDVDVVDDDNRSRGDEEEINGIQEESKNFDVLGDENGEKRKKKEKKRKREEGGSGELGEGEGGVVKEAKKPKPKTNKKNKKKKQKNKKKAKIGEEEDTNGGGVVVGNEELNKGGDSQVNNGYVATKVYVGGIPYSSTESDIKRYFESCGTIDEVDCMTFPDSGRFRGIAIITFRTEGAAKRALALDGSEMDGLLLKIQPYKTTTTRVDKTSDFAPVIVEGYNRIYVGNLSWDITEEDLRKLFSDCKIESIRFGMDKETGEFRGYAHVDFSDNLSLMMALKLDQEIACGRPVKISCAVPKKEGVKTESSSVPTQSSSLPTSNVVTSTDTENAGSGSGAVSGKIRRRTCYECGEKGHLSSACPKKTADLTNSNTS